MGPRCMSIQPDKILDRYQLFSNAFAHRDHLICYSVKANSNLSILKLLARRGSGFDIVSGGELQRILEVDKKAARRVVFSGVGKTAAEIDLALAAGILIFNVESESEVALLGRAGEPSGASGPGSPSGSTRMFLRRRILIYLPVCASTSSESTSKPRGRSTRKSNDRDTSIRSGSACTSDPRSRVPSLLGPRSPGWPSLSANLKGTGSRSSSWMPAAGWVSTTGARPPL